MSSRLHCWLHGHDWGPWNGNYENIIGIRVWVRWCRQCGAEGRW